MIPGGFKILGSSQELIVGVPSELGLLLANAGVRSKDSNAISEANVRTAINKFMGDCDKYGLYNCTLLSIDKEMEDDVREEAGIDDDVPVGKGFQDAFFSVKAFHRWDPELTEVVRDASKRTTTVTFKDDHGDILVKVIVSDESDDSDDSDESDQ